jgi:hypothetical protein
MDAKIDANEAKMDAAYEEVMAEMRVWWKEMKAGQETTEARLESKEPTSENESVVEYQEVSMEDATVKPVGELRKRHRGCTVMSCLCIVLTYLSFRQMNAPHLLHFVPNISTIVNTTPEHQ